MTKAKITNFRLELSNLMKKKNINTPKLARLTGMNMITLYNYFSGKSEMRSNNIEKLFNTLNKI